MFEKQIENIHSEMNLPDEMAKSYLQMEFNQFKAVLLSVISYLRLNKELDVISIVEINDIVKTQLGYEDYAYTIKTVNYLSATKTNILALDFVYFLETEGKDETVPLTPEQYFNLLKKDPLPPAKVFTEEQLVEIGGLENVNLSRLGFFSNVIRDESE